MEIRRSWMSRPYLSVKNTLFVILPSLFAGALPIFGEEREAASVSWCWERRECARQEKSLQTFVSFPSTGGVDVSLHTLGPTRVGHRPRSPGYAGRPRRSETVFAIIDASQSRRRPSKSALNQPMRSLLHALVVRAPAAFGRNPGDDLVGIHDVAGLAVHAVGGVQVDL